MITATIQTRRQERQAPSISQLNTPDTTQQALAFIKEQNRVLCVHSAVK